MGIFDKLQFWKHSTDDDAFSDFNAGAGADQSFAGSDQQSGFAQGVDSQGVTGQGDLPPLDLSSGSGDQDFQDPGSAPGMQNDPGAQGGFQDGFSQQPQQPQQQPPASQFPQQPSGPDDQVSMQTDDGEKRIGRGLAEEYIRHHSQQEQQGSQQQPPSSQRNNTPAPSVDHSLEMINVKLDSLKNAMDAMSQRLLKIENDLEKERRKGW